MLYLFKRLKFALYAFGILLSIITFSTAQAMVITLDKAGEPASELVAVKIALHDYVDNFNGMVDFNIDALIYLGKLEPSSFITNGTYNALEDGNTPQSTFTLSDVVLKPGVDGELLSTSVGFGPELMLALLVVDGNAPTNLFFNLSGIFQNVLVGDNKGISHLTAFGYLSGGDDLTPNVPIPAALPLFGTGIALLGVLSWRRKRKKS